MKPSHSPTGHDLLQSSEVYIPSSTYRLQFHRGFKFTDALEQVDYLMRLGVGACYASPLFQATPGSSHGYDVCNFNRLNPEIGTENEFDYWVARLQERRLGLILDMVPNHMGIGDPSNLWWWEVLEQGAAAPHAHFFDIDWASTRPGLAGRVLLPVLGDHYGAVLARGDLQLVLEEEALLIRSGDSRFPVAPSSYWHLLTDLGGDAADPEVGAIARDLLASLPLAQPSVPELPGFEKFKQVWQTSLDRSPFREAVDAFLARVNARPGGDESRCLLSAILDEQHYRLSHWRLGLTALNYRRFFDVTSLAGLRVEDPDVFAAGHQLLLRLISTNKVQGVRIDHPDGLAHPRQYFERLQAAVSESRRTPAPIYLLVEKILAEDEALPGDWPVHGTTGYDFMGALNGLFVDPGQEGELTRTYEEFTGSNESYAEIVRRGKRFVLANLFRSEMTKLMSRWMQQAGRSVHARDFADAEMEDAVAEVMACLPVYRTYISPDHSLPSPEEEWQIQQAVAAAKTNRPEINAVLFDFIGRILCSSDREQLGPTEQQERLELIVRFQQLTGPVMAKGVEDTAFYRYNRLISLNEVGGNPGRFGLTTEIFHRQNQTRRQDWPQAMLSTTTHDTKRGEDVRARLNVLSELPGEWAEALRQGSQLSAGVDAGAGDKMIPSRNTRYLCYQTLVGAWPPDLERDDDPTEFRDRVVAAMIKSAREAKVETSWLAPDEAYEKGLVAFIEGIFSGGEGKTAPSWHTFQRRLASFGYWNSLAQVLLKVASPGVPDFYQGTELWDFSLVDPDNRRPIDYRKRQAYLAEVDVALAGPDFPSWLASLLANPADGRIKLFVTTQLLRFRRTHEELFAQGTYVPVAATGARELHVVAFLRAQGESALVAIAPRLVAGLTDGKETPPVGTVWEGTELALPGKWARAKYRNVLTGEQGVVERTGGLDHATLRVSEVLATLPVALLELTH